MHDDERLASLAAIVESSGDAIYGRTLDGIVTSWNRAAERLFGYRAEEIIGKHIDILTPPGAEGETVRIQETILTGEVISNLEIVRIRKDGRPIHLSVTISPVWDAAGTVVGISGIAHDITERKRAEEQLNFQARLLDAVGQAVIATTPDGTITYWNSAAEGLYGWRADEVLGRQVELTTVDETCREQAAEIMERLRRGESWSGEFRVVRKDGSEFPALVTDTPVVDRHGALVGIIGVSSDLTERKALEEQLRHQALHDPLTGLPNRLLLEDRLQQAIRVARRDGSAVSVLLLDLDRFKEVNDTLGHAAGDVLLQRVAAELRSTLRGTDTVARQGGDEFAILLAATDAWGAVEAGHKVLSGIARPMAVGPHPVYPEASIGIASYPQHGEDAATLLRRADVAMYSAKRTGAGIAVYQAEADPDSSELLTLTNDLRDAIETAQLVLHYQPKLHLRTGQAWDLEALARWTHPTRGAIPPDEFIPLAEHGGLIRPLAFRLIDAALQQLRAWHDAGLRARVSVNLSVWNLHDPQLLDRLAALLERWSVAARDLEVEITESALMVDPARGVDVIRQLGDLGVAIDLDDFGTGPCSLAYLEELRLHEVKLNRTYVRDLSSGGAHRGLVRGAIGLAHGLGLGVVAEGVEDGATADLLRDWGCDTIQGSYVSPPLTAQDATVWLREYRSP